VGENLDVPSLLRPLDPAGRGGAAPSTARPQRAEPLTAARIRPHKGGVAEAKGDGNTLVLGLDRRFRERWGDFESFPVSITKRDDITIVLTMPYMRVPEHAC